MAAIAEAFGRLDVLVNNAGVGERSDFRHLDDEAWDRVWKTNLDGTVRCAREAFELLKASGNASIINLSSVMATKHTRQMSVYSATKGAVSALSRSLAVEYAPYGIRVNTLCPGYVETGLIGRYTANPMIAKGLLSQTPLRRFGTPQDIANAALFLASDEAGLCHRRRAPCRRRHGRHAVASILTLRRPRSGRLEGRGRGQRGLHVETQLALLSMRQRSLAAGRSSSPR